ncbi:hypothetical protein J2790_000540 [Paenarthrobacter nicotinovorans]|nr:hypothetical protein [Paenarthrobacter nicotinovorans]
MLLSNRDLIASNIEDNEQVIKDMRGIVAR